MLTTSFIASHLRSRSILENLLSRVRSKADTIGVVKLVLELHPLQTQRMEKALEHVHHEQHTHGDACKDSKTNVGRKPVYVERGKHGLLPKDSGELGVSKRQGPKTEVGSRVGNHTENKLYRLNSLVDNDFTKAVVIIVVVFAAMSLFVLIMVYDRLVCLLPGQEEGLCKKKNGNRTKGDKEQNVLDVGLSFIQRLVDIAGLKSNVDESRNEVGRLATVAGATVVEGALGGSVIVSSTRKTPRSTSTISRLVANNPLAIIVGASPSTATWVDARSRKHAGVPVDDPLHEDQHDHVHEERRGKCEHGKKLKQKVKSFAKVDGVATLEASSAKHLNDTNNDTELHLERIKEKQFIGRDMPDWVQTERVDVVAVPLGLVSHVSLFDLSSILTFKDIAGPEQVETKRKAIVVDETSINGKAVTSEEREDG